MISLLSEKSASSWLSALPVEEHGFALHKGAFEMLFSCVMGGSLLGYLYIVFVARVSL